MNTEQITREVCRIAKETAEYIRDEGKKLKPSDVEIKGLHNFVTHVDKTAEKLIVEQLKILLPEAGFITEENTVNQLSDKYNWIIDPLDGTTNFIHGVPCYSISIALSSLEQIISGVVLEINSGELFYAWQNGPAMCNDSIIHVSLSDSLDDSLLATGFPYQDYSLTEPYLRLFGELMRTTRGIRRLGSAAVDLAYVAAGRFDAFYEYGLNPWDVAAGSFIIKQAGGVCTDFIGGTDYINGKRLVASNGKIHNDLLDVINEYFERPT
ncbi:MAG: inositol monophosphatase family protein [Bacteroidales bacterium]|jgi:myo-inositol-1(or 4)-monophosphatase|nr:inositol monophosphatase family protein [Bacteroidales bacterium]